MKPAMHELPALADLVEIVVLHAHVTVYRCASRRKI